jgi:hypothetical protein
VQSCLLVPFLLVYGYCCFVSVVGTTGDVALSTFLLHSLVLLLTSFVATALLRKGNLADSPASYTAGLFFNVVVVLPVAAFVGLHVAVPPADVTAVCADHALIPELRAATLLLRVATALFFTATTCVSALAYALGRRVWALALPSTAMQIEALRAHRD